MLIGLNRIYLFKYSISKNISSIQHHQFLPVLKSYKKGTIKNEKTTINVSSKGEYKNNILVELV